MHKQISKAVKILRPILCAMIACILCETYAFADRIEGKIAEGTFDTGVELTYTNSRAGIIPTGVNLPSVILIIGITAVAAIIVVMIARKKIVKGE